MDIIPINGHSLVIRNAIQPVQLNSSCNIHARKLTGTLLINYRNCCIIIDGVKYDDKKTSEDYDITIIPTIGINFQTTRILNQPDVQQVNLLRIENRNHIDKLKKDHMILQHTTTGVMALFAIAIIGLMIWKRRPNDRGDTSSSGKVISPVNIENVPSSSFVDEPPTNNKIRDESSSGKILLSPDSQTPHQINHFGTERPMKFTL